VRIEERERLTFRLLHLEAPIGSTDAITGCEIFNLTSDGGRSFVTYQTIALDEAAERLGGVDRPGARIPPRSCRRRSSTCSCSNTAAHPKPSSASSSNGPRPSAAGSTSL
jgi:hypothetical protein